MVRAELLILREIIHAHCSDPLVLAHTDEAAELKGLQFLALALHGGAVLGALRLGRRG
jgi:hypothetical protein